MFLATALAIAACSPATKAARGLPPVAGSSQTASGAPAGFDDRQFDELLLAGRFAEAERALSAAPGQPSADTTSDRAAPPLRGDTSRNAARAWMRIAERDWRRRAPSRSNTLVGSEEASPPELLDAGLAAAHDAWPGGDPDLLTVAHQAADALEARGTTESRLFQAIVLAAIAAAQEERDLLALMLAQAQDLDQVLREAGRPAPASFQVGRLAGDLWLQVDRYADARTAFLAAANREPRDARAWLGLARTEAKLSNADASAEAYRMFLQRWIGADPQAEEIIEARAALGAGHQ
jgi:tetratricopeptide (TPR) repeat protein